MKLHLLKYFLLENDTHIVHITWKFHKQILDHNINDRNHYSED